MGLASVKEMLLDATAHGYAIPAINVFNYESVRWAILAAEEEGMPVIIQFYPGYTIHVSMQVIVASVKDLAKGVSVPVGLHLDHARDFETAIVGIKQGFTSVMIDGSQLPFEENAAVSKSVKMVAKVFDVDVEAELGHVGSGSRLDDFMNPHRYTDPAEVQRFVEITGVDSLAIAVGNGHGRYIQAPILDFDRIQTIRSKTDIPLVMHGGSGIPEDQVRQSVRCGISKFNIATEYGTALYAVQKSIVMNQDSHYGVLHAMEEGAKAFVKSKLRLLNPDHYRRQL